MKVKIEVTLDVDVAAWAEEFLIDRRAVNTDVKEYFRWYCEEQLKDLDCVRKVD